MPATSELIASMKTDEEVSKEIDADWLIYQRLEDLIDAVKQGNPEIQDFETSIFTGKYITPLIENYLEDLENSRKDELKMQKRKNQKLASYYGLTILIAGISAEFALST